MVAPVFLLPAVLCLLTFAVHFFVGGRFVVRPLLAATDITRGSRWLNYFCWHITTIVILAMMAAFLSAAADPGSRQLAWASAVLAVPFSLLSVFAAFRGRVNPLRFPPTSLFALVAAAGFWSLTA